MAKSENNEVMYGARGRVGNLLVFKNFGKDRTIISKRRKKPDNPVYSLKQELAKEKFREGIIYAKGALEDPVLFAFYKQYAKPGSSAYNMALADFCKPPQIKTINVENYLGMVGDLITIRATDNFKITNLKVSIIDPYNVLIETGTAIMATNSLDWVYQTTRPNLERSDSVIRVEATDTPGNVTTLERTIVVI